LGDTAIYEGLASFYNLR